MLASICSAQAMQIVCPQAVKTARDLGEAAKQILHSREKWRDALQWWNLNYDIRVLKILLLLEGKVSLI